jgi:hypothetical protein
MEYDIVFNIFRLILAVHVQGLESPAAVEGKGVSINCRRGQQGQQCEQAFVQALH